MKRRGCMPLLAGLGLMYALPLSAQQRKPARVGVLVLANWERAFASFNEALAGLGHVEGKNLIFEMRSAQGKPEALTGMAQQLVELNVDVIAAFQTPSADAARRATKVIPIVMAGVADPVAVGLVDSLARPGGNVTGVASMATELSAKNLEFVREIKPAAKRVGVLANATDPFTPKMLDHLQVAASATGLELLPSKVRRADEVSGVFAQWAAQRVDAVFVQGSVPVARAAELALQYRLPSVSFVRAFAEAGGLFVYGADLRDQQRKAARLVDKILKGAKPADLPVEQPTIFDVIVNAKTAKALGIKIPHSVLLRATEVIE